MARMLGRYETPGCCPGCCSGWTRNRKLFGLDCSGGATDKRWRKRIERREFLATVHEDLLDYQAARRALAEPGESVGMEMLFAELGL